MTVDPCYVSTDSPLHHQQPFTTEQLTPVLMEEPSVMKVMNAVIILQNECPRCKYFWQHHVTGKTTANSCEIGIALWRRNVLRHKEPSWPKHLVELESQAHCRSFTPNRRPKPKTYTARKD